MEKIVYLAFLLYILQAILTYFQIKNYRHTVATLKQDGIVGIGTKKKKIGSGNIVVLVSDEAGHILQGQLMQGVTVLARFKEMKDMKGIHIKELKEKTLTVDSKNTAMLDAVAQIESQLLQVNGA